MAKAFSVAPPGKANFLFLGDLNVMGLDYVHGKEGGKLLHDKVEAEQEVGRLAYLASKLDTRPRWKTKPTEFGGRRVRMIVIEPGAGRHRAD